MESMPCDELVYQPPSVSDTLTTPGPPAEPDASGLDAEQERVIAGLRVQLDTTVYRLLLVAKSSEEFRRLRAELFQRYVALSTAIGKLYKSDLTQEQFSDLLKDGYRIVADSVSSDVFLFGDLAREDALCSIDALHRAHALFTQFCAGLAVNELAQFEPAKVLEGIGLMLFSLMHLHAIMFGINNKIRPSAEVLAELVFGMRCSADAYANIRDVWGLRFESAIYSEV
jgi:hypothetical protein